MVPVFADTSFFIALVEANDEYHDAAVRLSVSIKEPLLTTSAVVLEMGASFCKTPKRRLFLRILELLKDHEVEVLHVNEGIQKRGVELFAQRSDKDWSLVDCISFLVMQDRNLQQAATCDEHFEQAGFMALLRQPHFHR